MATKSNTDGKKPLRDLFLENAAHCEEGYKMTSETLLAFCDGNSAAMKENAEKTIQIEKKQDRLRESIIERLFTAEVMVFSRPDRLKITEDADKLLDECEIVVRKMMLHDPKVPADLAKGLKEMAGKLASIGTGVKELIYAVLDDFNTAKKLVITVADDRRFIRELTWGLLAKTYELGLDHLDFYFYQNLIKEIVRASDQAEEFADMIYGLTCKYAL
jgi:predicted phosphate transport protein (TIGR00153 family)